MTDIIPFSSIKGFLVDGKGDQLGVFFPTDADLVAIINVLKAGFEDKHVKAGGIGAVSLASGAFKLLVFTGADAHTTAQSVTLTGAKVGDVVVGVVNMSDLATSTVFEGVITVVDKIQQASANLATKVCFVLLIAKGA